MNTHQGDAVVVESRAPHCTVPARQEITFQDGSSVWLHRVYCANGTTPNAFDRLVRDADDSGAGLRADLLQLAPNLAFHLPGESAREVSSAIWTSLRARYKSADALLGAMGRPLQ